MQSKRRLVIVPLLAASLATSLFVGIGPSSVASSQPKHTSVASSQPKHTLGLVLDAASDLAGVQLLHGATAAAKAAGWTVLSTDAESEPSKAISAMEDYVSRGVTAILVEVFEAEINYSWHPGCTKGAYSRGLLGRRFGSGGRRVL